MVYKVLITEEIDETLNNIDSYCIEHFKNYDYVIENTDKEKTVKEILYVASFLSENAGKTPLYSKYLYKYTSSKIPFNFYYSIDETKGIVYLEKMLSFKQKQ